MLGVEPNLARQAAVVRVNHACAQPLGELMREPFGQPPRVDEHERRSMLLDERRDAIGDLAPELVRRHGAELARRHLDLQIQRAPRADLHDDWIWTAGAGEELRDQLDRLLRRREPDARHGPGRQRVEPLERQREMRAALVVRHRVNLVHDDGADGPENGAALLGREQDVERFRRRDQNVWRAFQHRLACRHQRVARADSRADFRQLEAAFTAPDATISASGPSRFFWMSLPSALSGETYKTSVRSASVPWTACSTS